MARFVRETEHGAKIDAGAKIDLATRCYTAIGRNRELSN